MHAKHEKVEIEFYGCPISVDKGVRDLILLMNNALDLGTFTSCEGGLDEDGSTKRGYVKFSGGLRLLPDFAFGIFLQQQQWEKDHNHVCRDCCSMSISIEINGNGFFLRWLPHDYQRVLEMVKVIALETSRRSPSSVSLPPR